MSTLKPIYVQYAEEAVHARHNRNFQVLASAASNLYNHFVHNPKDYINVESPLAVGSIFASCLGYQEPDEDIQEVRAENAIYCLTQSVESQNEVNRNLSAAYLFLVFSIHADGNRSVVQKLHFHVRSKFARAYLLSDGDAHLVAEILIKRYRAWKNWRK